MSSKRTRVDKSGRSRFPCGRRRRLNLVAEQTQQPGQAGRQVLVVVHDQDPTLLRCLGLVTVADGGMGITGFSLTLAAESRAAEDASFTVPSLPRSKHCPHVIQPVFRRSSSRYPVANAAHRRSRTHSYRLAIYGVRARTDRG